MANSTGHSLPYPIKNARFSLPMSFRVAAGTLTDPTTPDTEFSADGGATFSDCAEEITTGGTNGAGYLTLTGAETNNNLVWIAGKSANCLTTPVLVVPRVLALVGSGTLSAGSAGGGTLGTLLSYDVTGCFIRSTGGTGGGGTGGANNQARKIATYNTSTGAFTVVPNWETTPDATTTYDVLLPEGVTLGMLQTINPTTAGRKLDVSAGGEAGLDWANVGSPTTTVVLSGTTIGVLTTYTGNTPQTGDGYAIVNSGTHGNAALKTLIDAMDNLIDTEITTLQASVDDLPTNAELATALGTADDAILTRLGTPAGASVSADLLVIDNLVDDLESRLTAARAGYLDNISVGAVALSTDAGTILLRLGPFSGLGSDTAYGVLGTPAGASLAADIATRASQASVDTIDDFLDTEMAATLAAVDTEVAAIQTAVVTSIPATLAGLLTTAMTESYRADGATGSVAQFLYELIAHHGEASIVSTTKTIKKVDGSTSAATFTLNSATVPTSITRAS